MYVVGVIEIAAGLAVLVAPRVGGFLVAAWLDGIVVNLLTNNAPEYYDIALRDFGLSRRGRADSARFRIRAGSQPAAR